eukprot:TRINITY_DN22772_c0_g1_i2.p1 TRINITY_DN22772_c0_g1~~TRINITY_DN22772_c0_g1_i2.p1  ORF type:complete len:377 (+),score=74.79 TRINITY_DN22772_c0_g1_i2:70-1200(+)
MAFSAQVAAVAAAVGLLAGCAEASPSLRYRPDGTLTIVQFTDLHLNWPLEEINWTVSTLNNVLEAEKPDFVAYTGDFCGNCWTRENQSLVFHAAMDPAEKRGIPFGVTFGNWDRVPDANFTGPEAMKFIIDEFQHTVNKPAPPLVDGDSIFDVPVLSPDGKKTASVLYFMDTHHNDGCDGISGTGCMYPSEVEWYNDTSHAYRKANEGKPVPAMAFFHIAMPEYMSAWNSGTCNGRLDETTASKGLGIGCVIHSHNFVETAVDNGDIKAMACGHDHDNDFHGTYKGIDLMYGRKTGYASYGPPASWAPTTWLDADGARVIQLKLDEKTGDVTVNTWIRLNNGTKLDSRQEGKQQGQSKQTQCNSAAALSVESSFVI